MFDDFIYLFISRNNFQVFSKEKDFRRNDARMSISASTNGHSLSTCNCIIAELRYCKHFFFFFSILLSQEFNPLYTWILSSFNNLICTQFRFIVNSTNTVNLIMS